MLVPAVCGRTRLPLKDLSPPRGAEFSSFPQAFGVGPIVARLVAQGPNMPRRENGTPWKISEKSRLI